MGESNSGVFSHFHIFPNLPPEIRNHIWFNALPTLQPSLHFYHRGCWRLEPINPLQEWHAPDGPERQVSFRAELVRKTWFEVPLVHVNHEARQATLKWAKDRGLPFYFLYGIQRLVFLRPFDINNDALGISYDEWDNVLFELDDRLDDPDLIGQSVTPLAHIKQVIMSTRLLERCVAEVGDLLHNYNAVKVLYIVDDDMLPRLELINRQAGPPPQSWGYRPSGGKSWRWNPEKHGFEVQGSDQIGSPRMYELMDEASQVLVSGLSWASSQQFSIEPATLYQV